MTESVRIPVESDTVCYILVDGDGNESGRIERTVCQLHRKVMEAQHNVFSVDEDGDYIPEFARLLTREFGFPVSDTTAYYIVEDVMQRFWTQKKSLDG